MTPLTNLLRPHMIESREAKIPISALEKPISAMMAGIAKVTLLREKYEGRGGWGRGKRGETLRCNGAIDCISLNQKGFGR